MDTRQLHRQAAAELAQKRTELDMLSSRVTALTKIVEGLEEYEPTLRTTEESEPVTDPTGVAGVPHHAGNTRQVVLALLEQANRSMTTTEIANDLMRNGWRSENPDRPTDAIRKALSRLYTNGQITREAVDKRSFRYATKSVADMSSDPTSTSASDATEAEVTTSTSGQGGDADGSPTHSNRDDFPRRNGDRDHRTPVGVLG